MVIKNRKGEPIEENKLYKELTLNQDKSISYPIVRVNSFSEDSKGFCLSLEYEDGTKLNLDGFPVYNVANRLIPLGDSEIKELIHDRRQRLNFLERAAQSQPKLNEEYIT